MSRSLTVCLPRTESTPLVRLTAGPSQITSLPVTSLSGRQLELTAGEVSGQLLQLTVEAELW